MISSLRELKKAVNYRNPVINLYIQGKINLNVYNILLTACYMLEICEEKEGNMPKILRYQMLSYIHTDLLIDFLGKT